MQLAPNLFSDLKFKFRLASFFRLVYSNLNKNTDLTFFEVGRFKSQNSFEAAVQSADAVLFEVECIRVFTKMIKGRDVVIISSIDWNFNWQGPQEIATRFAKMGNRILFIENTGVRSPELKDRNRIWSRLKYWWNKTTSKGLQEIKPNLFVCSPIVLPPFGSPLRKFINQKLFFPFIKKKAELLKMENPLIITFLPTDTAGDLIKLLRGKQSEVIYYVAGDFSKLVSDTESLLNSEKRVVEMCNAVITIVSSLTNRYKLLHKKVYTLPYGVNLNAFQNGSEKKVSEEVKLLLRQFEYSKQPVIGYVGAFHRYMNVELLLESSVKKKDWQWVFVGPVENNISKLEMLPNVSFLGQQSHEDLVHFIKSFDVCIIPYVNVSFTETVVPVKLNEYLAVGKPVVSTNIPAVGDFNETHNVIKITGNDAPHFLGAIEEFLAQPETAFEIEKRKSVAALFDWDLHIEFVCELLDSISNKPAPQKKLAASSTN